MNTYGPPLVTSVSTTRGPASGGTYVSVNGSGFQNGATVAFGGSSATSALFIGATQITCTTADHAAGLVDVVVTNPGGRTGTLARGFEYVAAPVVPNQTTTGYVNTSFDYQIAASQNPDSYDATGLPSWALVDNTTGHITGTPDATGVTNATVSATNVGGTGSGSLQITINNAVPTLSSISPTSGMAGDPAFTLTVSGTGFVGGSVVRWGGTNKATTFVSTTQLTASIGAGDIAAGGTVNVTVFNPTPGGGSSSAQQFTVNNPAPTLTSISPASKTAGEAAFTLTLNGTNFVASSVVQWQGQANLTPATQSATQITANVPASYFATAGTPNVTVFNPTPAGGTTAPQTFTINNPVPTLTSISPASKTAGDAAFTLTLNGTNFVASSVVKWQGQANLTTATQNATQITVNVPASYIAAASVPNVTVSNPTPGGGESSAQQFTVNNPVPGISSISPSSKTAGDAAFTLTVNGSNFVSGSVVRWAGTDKTTTYVSAAKLTATIGAADIANQGTVNVTVFNAGPGGGASTAATFTVDPSPPVITSATSASGTVGVAFSYQITATNSPTSYNATGLPSWASVNTSTGVITGTPNASGSTNVTISAKNAVGSGTATITISARNVVATPAFSPAAGTYSSAQSVTISSTTGATIYYTTDGSTPTTSSQQYSGAFAVSSTTTIKAYAVKSGMVDSAVASAAYTINTPGQLSITRVWASANPAKSGVAVSFGAAANETSVTWTWNFGDGTATISGDSPAHAFTTSADTTFTIAVTANDGVNTATRTLSLSVLAPAPPPGSSGPPTQGFTPTAANPLDNVSIQVLSSDGGVVELLAGLNGTAVPDGYSVSMAYWGAQGLLAMVQGAQQFHKFTQAGVYVVVVTVKDQAGTLLGTASLTLPISAAETGSDPGTRPPTKLTIFTSSLKGKFLFSARKLDSLSFKGIIQLPANMDITKPQTVSVALGNVADTVDLNNKGRAKASDKLLIKNMSLKYPRLPRGTNVTSPEKTGTLSFTMSAPRLDSLGFSSDGISQAAVVKGGSVTRTIQIALVLDGTAYRDLVPVTFKLSKKGDSGQITNIR